MNELRERIEKLTRYVPDYEAREGWIESLMVVDEDEDSDYIKLSDVLDSLHSVEGDDHEFDQPSKDPTITRMRVPSGWIYYAWCIKTDSLVLDSGVFVPFPKTKQEGEG